MLTLILLVIGAFVASRLIIVLAGRICRIDFRPAELVAQTIVERVAANWLTHAAVPEAASSFAFLLETARRRTRNPEFKARIAAIREQIARTTSPTAAEYREVGGRLLALLKWHAALTPRPRQVPSSSWQFAFYRNNLVDFVLIGCTAVLVWQASYLAVPSAGPSLWESIARFIGILLLVHAVLVASTIVGSSVLLYRSHAKFRSLLVTSRPISDPLVRRAIGSLAPHGKLFAFLLDQHQPAVWPDLELQSLASDIFFTESSYFPTVIASLAAHSDFLVLETDAETAAQLLPMLEAMPKSRRGLLVDLGMTVPEGYIALQWADFAKGAMARRFDWADRDGAVPDYSHTGHSYGGRPLIYSISAAVILVGTALLAFENLRLLGAYALLSGVLGIYPKFLGARRRYRSTPRHLGKPQSTRISHLLTYYRSWTPWIYSTAQVVAFGLAYSIYDKSSSDIANTIALGIIIFASGSLFLLLVFPGLLRALKWYLDWNFRIVVLHRNLPANSQLHKHVVMPICGCYGQVIMASEQELASLRIEGGAKFAHEVLSEDFYTIRHDDHLEPWTSHIAREIGRADFAVFDWRVDVSPAMIWEFKAALTALPPRRIMFLCESETKDRTRQVVEELCGPEAGNILILELLWLVPLAELLFREELRRRLSGLETEPRPVAPVEGMTQS